jgi:hypothetical protein
MSTDQALHDLSQEVSELSRILTNVQMDRDAYKAYAYYLRKRMSEVPVVWTFDEFILAENIPHPSRQP